MKIRHTHLTLGFAEVFWLVSLTHVLKHTKHLTECKQAPQNLTVDMITGLHTEAFYSSVRNANSDGHCAEPSPDHALSVCRSAVTRTQGCPNLRTQIIGTSVPCLLSAWYMLRNLLESAGSQLCTSGVGGSRGGRGEKGHSVMDGNDPFLSTGSQVSLMQCLWVPNSSLVLLLNPTAGNSKHPHSEAQQTDFRTTQSCTLPTSCPLCDEATLSRERMYFFVLSSLPMSALLG